MEQFFQGIFSFKNKLFFFQGKYNFWDFEGIKQEILVMIFVFFSREFFIKIKFKNILCINEVKKFKKYEFYVYYSKI